MWPARLTNDSHTALADTINRWGAGRDVEAVRQSTMPHQHDNRIQETEITEYKIKKIRRNMRKLFAIALCMLSLAACDNSN